MRLYLSLSDSIVLTFLAPLSSAPPHRTYSNSRLLFIAGAGRTLRGPGPLGRIISTRNWLEWACPIYNNLLPGVRLRISPPDLHPRSCSTRNSAYDWLEGSQLLDRTNLTDMQISWHMIHLRDPDSLSIGDCRYLLLVQYRVWGMMSLLVHVTSSVSVEV